MGDSRSSSCDHRGPAGFDRRTFLRGLAATGAVAGLASAGLATRYAFADAAYSGDVLVVVSLRGGMDGLNAFVPTGDPAYSELRPTVGIPQGALIPLDSRFGMHPALQPLLKYWDARTLGIVHAVGQASPSRSHFDAMEEMERAAPGSTTRTGWLDRTLGLRGGTSAFQAVGLGSSMAPASLRGPTPELALGSVDEFSLVGAATLDKRRLWKTALSGLYTGAPVSVGAPAAMTLAALDAAGDLQATPYAPANGVVYPTSELGRALEDVARLVKANVGLQVACIDYGDWDMHAGMGTTDSGWLHDHLAEMAAAMAAFADDLGAGLSDVTLVTLTEFGRRAAENGSGGVDHGHGQAVMLLGGGVRGGVVHGAWPGLGPDDLIAGDLAGTTDYRVLLAEILERRCGAGSLTSVFPGLPADRLGIVEARA